jgi:hypothetical protein
MSIQDQLPDTELAQSLKHSDFLEKHLNHVIMGVVGFLVVFAVVLWFLKSSVGDNQKAWGQFESATTPEDFDNVADDYPGTTVSAWSRLMSGERLLGEAVRLMFTDRKAANTQLADAETRFDELIEANHTGILLQVSARAYLGKARVLEMTLGEDVADAIEAYEKLQRPDFKEFGYDAMVESRIKALAKKSTQEFYAWFDEQSPNPSDRKSPFAFDGLPPNHPSLIPITLPPIPPELYPAEWSELSEDPGPTFEAPKSIDDAKADDAKADDAKADDAKADDAKADDAKADDAKADDAKADDAKADDAKADDAKADDAKADDAKADNAKADDAKADDAKADDAKADDAKADDAKK